MRSSRDNSDLEGYERRRLWAWPLACLLLAVMVVLVIMGIWIDVRFAMTAAALLVPTVIFWLIGADTSGW